MIHFKRLSLLTALVCGLAMASGCTVGEGPGDAPAESSKTLDELLATPWEDMSDADRDRLALLTGSMSQIEYDMIYHPDRAIDTERSDPQALFLGAGSWRAVPIPGGTCSDGSEYKIFVNYAKDRATRESNRVVVFFEPGGACWDYESCSGDAGIRGASNPNGIPDNHMSILAMLNPFASGGSPNALISPIIWASNPIDRVQTSEWNRVFIPYCTGDVFSGNTVAVYEDPSGQNPPLTFHHKGVVNVELAAEWISQEFAQPEQLLVAGCSAGGTGALTSYDLLRTALQPHKSYLLDDSGPIFSAPGTGNHYPLQQRIKEAWNLQYLIDRQKLSMPGYDLDSDMGVINEALAETFPEDRLAVALFQRDRVYSGYSYARFFDLDEEDPADREEILRLWNEDVDNLVALYDSHDNLSYYMPYMRPAIDSHCVSIIDWTGTEIQERDMDMGDFIDELLTDGQVDSYKEGVNPDDSSVRDILTWLVDLVYSK